MLKHHAMMIITRLQRSPLQLALLFSTILLISLYSLFQPIWETNDDVAMSMMAHGYGIAATGSPLIVFSNVLWGYWIRAIPNVHGVFGYSIATLITLFTISSAMMYSFLRLRLTFMASAALVSIILIRPALMPQFTMNAGLLMASAVINWLVYAQKKEIKWLIIGCILAFCSYLVRDHVFFLIGLVSCPLLPWQTLWRQRAVRIALLCLTISMGLAAFLHHQAYQNPDWSAYHALNPARLPFTDYDAGTPLKQRPDILTRYGYSLNDIDLITGWFFVDPELANPDRLSKMLTELGPLPMQAGSIKKGLESLQILQHPRLFTLFITALLLLRILPNRRIFMSWGLFLLVLFGLGLMGRPGVFRVVEPVLDLLLVMPFVVSKRSCFQIKLATGVLVIASVIQIGHVVSDYRVLQQRYTTLKRDLMPMAVKFHDSPLFIWGAQFPYEAMNPVLGTPLSSKILRLYGLGWPTWAPNAVSYREYQAGRGLKARFIAQSGLFIMASSKSIKQLRLYCKERLHGHMPKCAVQSYGTLRVHQCRCDVSPVV